jgi:hypothetical protein
VDLSGGRSRTAGIAGVDGGSGCAAGQREPVIGLGTHCWGARKLGVIVSATSVRSILRRHFLGPSPPKPCVVVGRWNGRCSRQARFAGRAASKDAQLLVPRHENAIAWAASSTNTNNHRELRGWSFRLLHSRRVSVQPGRGAAFSTPTDTPSRPEVYWIPLWGPLDAPAFKGCRHRALHGTGPHLCRQSRSLDRRMTPPHPGTGRLEACGVPEVGRPF